MTHLSALALSAALAALGPAAQTTPPAAGLPNAVFLVAKPTLRDPNFRRTVVLATRTPGGGTVGVILNRPTPFKAADILPPDLAAANYRGPVFFGGPVLTRAIVALFQAGETPSAPAFHVLPGVYLTMHPDNIKELLRAPDRRYRLYIGFSGWQEQQLESELEREDWYVMPADEEAMFRDDTSGLWRELISRATGTQAAAREGALSNDILPPRKSTTIVSFGAKRPSRIAFESGFSISD